MTSLLTYFHDSIHKSAPSVSSSPEKSSLSHDSESSTTFVIQPPSGTNVLAKRLNTAELGDLITKKIKTKSTNISSNASLEHSPLSRRNLNSNDNTTSRTLTTDEDRSMAIEEFSDDETNSIKKSVKTQIHIPPFEVDSDELTADSTCSLSKEHSTKLPSASFSMSSDQENAIQLSNALEVLKLRLMAYDEERLRDNLMKILLAQEPVNIPSFAEMDSVVKAVPIMKIEKSSEKKVENDFEITYGEVEFPFMSLSVPYGQSQNDAKSNLSELFTQKNKQTAMSDELSTPSKLSKRSSLLSDDDKKSKKESLAATRAGTQKSSTDTDSVAKKAKKAKKPLSIMDNIQTHKKTNIKTTEGVNTAKEKIQNYMTEEGYTTMLNNKKSRAERQRTRWQLTLDDKFTVGDYLTHFINGGFSDQKRVKVPIGSDYQVDVSRIPFKQVTAERRQVKVKWNPASYNQGELASFMKSLKTCLKTQISQEQAIDLLIRNDNNMKKALSFAKTNKARCLAELAAKAAANLTP